MRGDKFASGKKILEVSTCVSDRRDVAEWIGRQLFPRKPAETAASSLCIHTAVQRDTVWAMKSNCEEAISNETQHVTLLQHHMNVVTVKLVFKMKLQFV